MVLVARGLFDGEGNYEATLRAVAYSSALAVFVGLPLIPFFALLYQSAIVILGISAAHSFDTVRATLTLGAALISAGVLAWAIGILGWTIRTSPAFG